jgi:conjugal transfer pilus assembly protein TraF
MIHRQSITVLVAASLTSPGTAPLRASDSDGVEVRQSEDALYCKERKLGTWFYCEKPKEEPRKSCRRAATGARAPCRDRHPA